MLDHNTDRMWYVIGAVIIGAAIIFILNGTMPELFASVGETFESKTEDVTKVVDELSPTDSAVPVRRVNLLDGVGVSFGHLDSSGKFILHGSTSNYPDRTTDFIDVSEIDNITVSLYDTIPVDRMSGFNEAYGRVHGYDEQKQSIRMLTSAIQWMSPTHITIDVSDVSYIRANLLLQNEFRYKIEQGTESTAY